MPTVAQLRAAQKSSACPRDGVSGMPSRRVLLSHRVCAPEHAAYVELRARDSPQLLPRRHQDDRGPAREDFGHHELAPAGAHQKIPIWQSRDHWLTIEVPVILAEARRRGRLCVPRADGTPGAPVSEKLLKRYLTVRSGYADKRTGRHCVVRPDTLASVLQCDERTVQRLQAVARAIGVEVVTMTGRMLTKDEKLKLWWDAKRAGVRPSRQRGLSTEVAFTNPFARQRNLWIVTPARGSALKTHHHQISRHVDSQAAASGRRNRAASRRRPPRSPVWHVQARPIAEELAQILPWLRSESLRRLLPCLKRFAVAPEAWTAAQLVDAIDDLRIRTSGGRPTRSITLLDASRIRTRPAILLASLLRRLDVTDDWTPPVPTCNAAGVDQVDDRQELEPACSCSHEHCDRGWLSADPTNPWASVVRCPSCINSCRHSADPSSPAYGAAGTFDEPPF